MGKDGMAYELFKFIQKDVTSAQIHEASTKAFESKLPKDPSKVEKPMEEIQQLAEEKKDKNADKKADKEVNKDIKTANAGVTEEPEVPKVIAELQKESPDATKLTQDKDGLDPNVSASMKKAKEEKKIEPKVSGVEKVKEAAAPKKAEPTIGDKEKEADEADEKELKDGMKEAKDAKAVKATSAKEEKKTEEVTGMKAEKAQNEAVKNIDYINVQASLNRWGIYKIYGSGAFELVSFDTREEAEAAAPEIARLLNVEYKGVKEDSNESKLPADPSKVEDPAGDIQKLAEEVVLTSGIQSEDVANDMVQKYSSRGARKVADEKDGKKSFIIMVKEAKPSAEHKCTCGNDGACKGSCSEGNTEVTITTDEKEVNINSVDGATQVTTIDKSAAIPPEGAVGHEASETPAEEKAEQEAGDTDDADDILMAEKIYVTELLKVKKTLTEKEQAFISSVEAVQLDEAKKEKVLKALKALKSKSKKALK